MQTFVLIYDLIFSECNYAIPGTFYHAIILIAFIFISFPRGQVGREALGPGELVTLSGSHPTGMFLSKL